MRKEFYLRAERKEGILLFRLNGDITGESEEEFKSMLPPGDQVGPVVLDFTRVDYINSAGLALIIGLVRRCRENGRTIGAFALSSHYRKIFNMVGLNDYITVFEGEDSARTVLGAKTSDL